MCLRDALSPAILAILLLALASPAIAQTNQVTLDRVTYLTNDLDSLTKALIDLGFAVERGPHELMGTETNYVRLPSGQAIDLESTASQDATDWRSISAEAYGTHVSGLRFRVPSAAELYLTMDSLGIAHGALHPGHTEDGALYLGFGLENPQPLDITFISYDSSDHRRVSADPPPNHLRRITWLLLSASPEKEQQLRAAFDAMKLHRCHEGCCDYWLIGPPENRVALRFELPTTTFQGEGEWISIEPGGLIFGY